MGYGKDTKYGSILKKMQALSNKKPHPWAAPAKAQTVGAGLPWRDGNYLTKVIFFVWTNDPATMRYR